MKPVLVDTDILSLFFVPLTEESVMISSDIYANLRKAGTPIDDIDILIAGVAISNNFILVTNNEDHFNNIEELEVLNWSKTKAVLNDTT